MRKEQLDGLRFVLFLMIFATHYAPNPLSVGYLGYALPVFFVMSGFLITNVLLSADQPSLGGKLKVFYLRRILRICPAYYLVVGLLIVMGSLSYPAYYLSYLLNIKLFMASLDPSAAFEQWFVQGWRQESMHLWSLSVEEQFYVLYPILLYLTPVRYRIVLLFLLLLGSIAVRLWLMSVFPKSFFGTLLPVCAEYFIWGCLFSCWEHKKSLSFLSPSWTVAVAAIAVLGLIIIEFQLQQNGFLQFTTSNFQTPIAMAMGFFIWGLWSINDSHLLARILTQRPFVYFGAMSYTLYLVHLLALDCYRRIPIDLLFSSHTDAVVGSFVLSLVMAMTIWHLFEKPIYSLKRYLPYSRNS